MAGHRATRSRSRRGERGFTLIELLVVVTIIGILAAVVSVGVAGFTDSSKIKARQAQVGGVQTAVDAYMSVNTDPTTGKAILPGVKAGASLANTDRVDLNALFPSGWYDKRGDASSTTQPIALQLFFKVDLATLESGGYVRLNATATTFICAFEGADSTTVKSRVLICHD